ncbi:MAG TPA: carboxypeptidase regulatory-like domain-containing protein [Anaerohalosphaeraceae bacterium]|nr:carboxypeptidase regulatory-like domain-containing protein [Anaerohalosphaeraceae bacterium]HOL88163.1 carboxypeptidase regulatory-like domain-containing protein [Anaerohalosphaeraceae bacterium]HPP56022.1 carboxypeptidase regulatory-like domain-containing protein [Anaerohalosphaeraceae bacterium]
MKKFYAHPTFFTLCKVFLPAMILVCFAILLLHKKIGPEDLTPSFEVSGTVTDAQTGRPIAGAVVYDDGYGPLPRQQTITDPNGVFRLKTWNEEHNITARAEGYKPQTLVLKTFPFDNANRLHFKLEPGESEAIASVLGKPIFRKDMEPQPELMEQYKSRMTEDKYAQ